MTGLQNKTNIRFAGDTIVARKPGLLEAEVDGEIVALHIDSGKCYGMNEVASHIWSLIASPMPVLKIEAALMGRYEVGQADCREQTAALLAELEREGLIAVTTR